MDATTETITASRIATSLGVSEGKVKAILQRLEIEPAVRRGCCRLYTEGDLQRVRLALQD